MIWKNICYKSK